MIRLLLVCAGCAGMAPRDASLEIAWAATAALTACDVGGTIGSTNMGRYDREVRPGYALAESNPVLVAMPGFGATPSVAAMIGFPAAATAISYAVTRARIPTWMRWSWLAIVGVVEGVVVVRNARWAGACGILGTDYPEGP